MFLETTLDAPWYAENHKLSHNRIIHLHLRKIRSWIMIRVWQLNIRQIQKKISIIECFGNTHMIRQIHNISIIIDLLCNLVRMFFGLSWFFFLAGIRSFFKSIMTSAPTSNTLCFLCLSAATFYFLFALCNFCLIFSWTTWTCSTKLLVATLKPGDALYCWNSKMNQTSSTR